MRLVFEVLVMGVLQGCAQPPVCQLVGHSLSQVLEFSAPLPEDAVVSFETSTQFYGHRRVEENGVEQAKTEPFVYEADFLTGSVQCNDVPVDVDGSEDAAHCFANVLHLPQKPVSAHVMVRVGDNVVEDDVVFAFGAHPDPICEQAHWTARSGMNTDALFDEAQ